MFMRLLRCSKPHVLLVDMPTQVKMGFIIRQNQAKITWVIPSSFTDGLTNFTPFFLIGISLFWQNLLFKSFWMILCTVVVEMPISLDSCFVNFRGYCSRRFLTAWTLARVLTVTYSPLWPLLSFSTLPVFLNFLTIFVVFLHGVFLPGNSLWNSLLVRTPDFVEK